MASDKVTEYERKRLENIKRNSEMMASLKIHSHALNLAASSKRLRFVISFPISNFELHLLILFT